MKQIGRSILILPPVTAQRGKIMTIILNMFDFMYFMITETIGEEIFNFFFYMFILFFIIKFVREAICW